MSVRNSGRPPAPSPPGGRRPVVSAGGVVRWGGGLSRRWGSRPGRRARRAVRQDGTMAVRKVIVAGGGVAGSATALALREAGIEAEVFEAHASGGADAGAFLTVM